MKLKVKSQKLKVSGGFTLVELLASIIVLVAVGSIITGIITSSLRGANKTNSIENIRQIGNFAISQMSKDITFAQTLDGFSEIGEDGTYVTACYYTDPPRPAVKFIKVTSVNGVQNIYKCDGVELSVNGTSLVDSTVALTNCSFTCTQTSITDVPIIEISFDLGPKNSTGLVENSSPPVTFRTSVTVRNYRK